MPYISRRNSEKLELNALSEGLMVIKRILNGESGRDFEVAKDNVSRLTLEVIQKLQANTRSYPIPIKSSVVSSRPNESSIKTMLTLATYIKDGLLLAVAANDDMLLKRALTVLKSNMDTHPIQSVTSRTLARDIQNTLDVANRLISLYGPPITHDRVRLKIQTIRHYTSELRQQRSLGQGVQTPPRPPPVVIGGGSIPITTTTTTTTATAAASASITNPISVLANVDAVVYRSAFHEHIITLYLATSRVYQSNNRYKTGGVGSDRKIPLSRQARIEYIEFAFVKLRVFLFKTNSPYNSKRDVPVDVYISDDIMGSKPDLYDKLTLFVMAILNNTPYTNIGRGIVTAMGGFKPMVKQNIDKKLKRRRILNGSIYNNLVYSNALKTRVYTPRWSPPIPQPYNMYSIRSNSNVNKFYNSASGGGVDNNNKYYYY